MKRFLLGLILTISFGGYGQSNFFWSHNTVFPKITTTNTTSITTTTAMTGGTITSTGGGAIIARGVCWSTSINPTIALNTKTTDGIGSGVFTSNLTGLVAGTNYYVRAYATNSLGTAYGENVNFTTNSLVTTNAISSITATTAISGGNIIYDGGGTPIARGVCWNTTSNPTIYNSKTTDLTGFGEFTSIITGLTAGTTYYVRAYKTTSLGTTYGSELTFTTLQNLTVGETYWGGIIFYLTGTYPNQQGLVCTPIDLSLDTKWDVKCCSLIEATGTAIGEGQSNTNKIVEFWGELGYGHAAKLCDDLVLNGYSDWFLPSKDELGLIRTNLNINQNSYDWSHYYWSSSEYSVVEAWSQDFVFGNQFYASKTTANAVRAVRAFGLPYVTTITPSSIYSTSAISGGLISQESGSPITARGVCWSTLSNPTINDSKTIEGRGSGSFNSTISGLSQATLYHVRAYATNSLGTAYGQDISFTSATTTTTLTATNITALTATLNGFMNAYNLPTTVTFEYGITTDYGNVATATQSPVSGNSNTYVSATITGLSVGTTYHYRVVATNSFGTSYGNDLTFSTKASFIIGDTYQGGIIFYITGTYPNQHGLVCAPSDQSSGIQWYNGSNVTTNATGTTNGTGQTNTTKIVTVQGTGNYAAKLCDNLDLNGYTDWFLPSYEELGLMYTNLKANGFGGFANSGYWSSTEISSNQAMYQDFSNGTKSQYLKNSIFKVRAVRSF